MKGKTMSILIAFTIAVTMMSAPADADTHPSAPIVTVTASVGII